MSLRTAVAGLALGLSTTGVLAQERTAQFDINTAYYQFHAPGGAPAPFGGLNHNGSVKFDMHNDTDLAAFLIRTGGVGNPFVNAPGFSGDLTALGMTILLSNGNITGGTLELHINGGPSGGGDSYKANINPGGSIQQSAPGVFQIGGLTSNGQFSDNNFGGHGIADFFNAQGNPVPLLLGSFLSFNMQPNAFGKGPADLDIFVSNVIPSPGSLALLGLGGLFAARRRR